MACTLSAADLRDRRGAWTRLCERALTAHRATAAGVELAFRPDPGVERTLRELARLERECCSFAQWSVDRSEDELVLEVTASDASGIAAVRALLT